MKKRQNNSARASALQITLSVALLSVSAILFASSFKAAAPAAPVSQNATAQQDGFFPPLPLGPGTPTPAPTVTPAPVTVNLPNVILNTTDPICTIFPVFVTVSPQSITAAMNYVAFQGDFTFDATVVSFDPGNPVQPAGMTGSTAAPWTVAGNILPGGGPTSRILRVLGFVNNTTTALVGTGNLYQLNMIRVKCNPNTNPPATTPLIWSYPGPDEFEFIDGNGRTPAPTQNNGSATVTGPDNCPVLDHFKAYRTTGTAVDPTDGNNQVQLRDQFDGPTPTPVQYGRYARLLRPSSAEDPQHQCHAGHQP